jgi:hypothetical protein
VVSWLLGEMQQLDSFGNLTDHKTKFCPFVWQKVYVLTQATDRNTQTQRNQMQEEKLNIVIRWLKGCYVLMLPDILLLIYKL